MSTSRSATAAVTSATCFARPSTSLVWSRPETFNVGLPNSGLGDLQLALVALGVDHPHAGRRDGDVVDVRPRAGDAPVVQNRNIGAVFGERLLDELLAAGAARPASLVLRRVLQREDHAADAWVTGADTRCAPGFAALTLAPGTAASCAVNSGWVGHAPRVCRADGAIDHPPASLH